MSEEKVILTLITDVYCNDEYAEKPEVAVIELTQSDIDRIKELCKVCDDNNLATATVYDECCWYDRRPLFNFEELGDRFAVIRDYDDDDINWQEETDPNAETNFGRIDSEYLDVSPHGIYFRAHSKYGSAKFESVGFGLQMLEKLLNDPLPEKSAYYFPAGAEVPAFEDLPKYLNDDDPGIKMYAREMLKQGGSNQ